MGRFYKILLHFLLLVFLRATFFTSPIYLQEHMIYKFFKLQEANFSLHEQISKITEDGRKKINELLKINEDLEIKKQGQRLRNILEDGGARGDTTLGKLNVF